MSEKVHLSSAISPFLPAFLPNEVEKIDSLVMLARDLRWSWNHGADKLWQLLDDELWQRTYNPWIVLRTVSWDKLKNVLADPNFCKILQELLKQQQLHDTSSDWFKDNHSQSSLTCAAYFSMEFMLSEALPIYSGGLGNVAGDQLKAASDLGVPVVGIGLLYQQGYFRQMIDKDGWQHALFPYNDPGQLPIKPVRKSTGEWLRIEIGYPGWSMWLRAWEVKVGKVKLYLLDSNDIANLPIHRGITSELYGGGSELRLMQEIILGIGGWRLLTELGIKPEVCHLNEGHAAFAVLERARNYMTETSLPFDAALAITRAGNLFTTHTAVAAGFDRFSPFLMEQYLKNYAQNKLGITTDELLALGRSNPKDPNEPFNMATLAIRGSRAVNAVSKLHGKVSRQLFAPLFPRWPVDEVPIGHVTNGVHMPSWDSKAADALWTEGCGKSCWLGKKSDDLEDFVRKVPDAQLWQMRNENRKALVDYARDRIVRQLEARGEIPEKIEDIKDIFDPNILTLGFARRFATYKRPNMLLYDQERLVRILTNSKLPVQLVIAGKAHPADKAGQDMIQQWIRFISRPEVRPHVIFLSDYDMLMSEKLVQGVDVWINTPRRPWEACGTSGMKVLVNGGINLSELDGWWAEAYTPEVGWAIGDGKEHGDDPAWDAKEARELYDRLERDVIPKFYNRDSNGFPNAWISEMRESMAQLTPRFSATRAVSQYTEEYYLPNAKMYLERAADNAKLGKQIINWERSLKDKWERLRIENVKVKTSETEHEFEVHVYLDDLDPNAVKVELYAAGLNNNSEVRQEMQRMRKLEGESNSYAYVATVSAKLAAMNYTPRVLPNFAGVSVPLEANYILWQK
jgi:glycogen phosphorylase